MKRYEALQQVSALLTPDDLAVVSIGTIANEWYSLMPGDGSLFLSLMGGVVPFAFGLSVALPHRRVVAIDTDGSFLSNPGALCTVVNEAPANLTILVIDNEMYEGVGGHPTHTSRKIDLERLATGTGMAVTGTARDPETLARLAKSMLGDKLPGFVNVKVQPGSFRDFPPDKVKLSDGTEDKYKFIRHVERLEGISIKPPYVRS